MRAASNSHDETNPKAEIRTLIDECGTAPPSSFRKIDGKWRVTHEHISEPFDMQTFKALLDLQP